MDQIQVEYLDGQSYMDVLVKVRDYIQNGWVFGNASDDREA